jgi:hypothetical protein
LTYKNNQNEHFIFFLNSTQHREPTQKFSSFLELYNNHNEINKNYYYLTFLEKKEKKTKFHHRPAALSSLLARSNRTRGPSRPTLSFPLLSAQPNGPTQAHSRSPPAPARSLPPLSSPPAMVPRWPAGHTPPAMRLRQD